MKDSDRRLKKNARRQTDGDRISQKSKSSLAAQFVLAADHFCEVFWDTCVAGALAVTDDPQ